MKAPKLDISFTNHSTNQSHIHPLIVGYPLIYLSMVMEKSNRKVNRILQGSQSLLKFIQDEIFWINCTMLLFNNSKVFLENSLRAVKEIRKNSPNFLHSFEGKILSKSRDYTITKIRILPIFLLIKELIWKEKKNTLF